MNNELPILISFSGGRTSAFMTKFLLEYAPLKDVPKVVIFANTGKENNATLDFVNECDKRWGLDVVWVEAKVNQEKGIGTSFSIVDYKTADRVGRVFEDAIRTYGLPSQQTPTCTRELKQIPINKYMRSLGYKDWRTAIGIRADEPNRINHASKSNKNIFYPLNDMIKVDSEFIRRWWDNQPFDLQLKDYQGNCDLCYKKSKRKRLTLLAENPNMATWWNEMEVKYGKDAYLFDQRDGLSILDLVALSKQKFNKAVDAHDANIKQLQAFEPDMDIEFACMCKST